jgi:20S proteasome subunit beta 3
MHDMKRNRHVLRLLLYRTIILAAVVTIQRTSAQQQQDPSTMNGGSIMAMAGRQCLAVAVDKRFASSGLLVQVAPRSILHVPNTLTMVVFTGLESDVQALKGVLSTEIARKYSRGLGFGSTNPQGLSAKSMASLTSHVLYNRKRAPYYVSPLVVGLDPTLPSDRRLTGALRREIDDGADAADESSSSSSVTTSTTTTATGTTRDDDDEDQPLYASYLCSMDCIGARSESPSFVCAGAAKHSLYGTCEALWRPELDREELLAVCCKAFLSALERDCLSGYGAVVYLITPDGIEEMDITGRTD